MGSLTGKYAVWMVGWLMTGAVMANDTTLLGAVKNGELDTVQQLIADGTDVNVSSLDGSSALLLATRANHIGIAQALIEAGANVNQKNLIRDSAYLLAGARGRNEILELALAHGADLKSTNRYGGTALIPAAERGHVELGACFLDMVAQALAQACGRARSIGAFGIDRGAGKGRHRKGLRRPLLLGY